MRVTVIAAARQPIAQPFPGGLEYIGFYERMVERA